MSNYASDFSLEPRLCVKTETVITYPLLYPHISIVVQGNLKLYQLFPLCKPYLPKSSDELVEFRPVCRGGFEQTPFWLSSGLQNMQAHNKKCILIKTSVRHKLCSIMGTSANPEKQTLLVLGCTAHALALQLGTRISGTRRACGRGF